MTVPEFSPDRGLLRLTTSQVEALARGDRALLGDGEDARTLRRLGVLSSRGVDPSLAPLLEVLRRPTQRFGLRVERGDEVVRHRGWVGRTGVAVLSGAVGPDAVQDIRTAPRPSSVARVLWLLLDLDPQAGRAVVEDDSPVEWERWRDTVHARSTWAVAADRTPRLLHLRWAADPTRPASTLLVLADLGRGGVVEARRTPASSADTDAPRGWRPVPCTPLEVWTGLTALARRADAGP